VLSEIAGFGLLGPASSDQSEVDSKVDEFKVAEQEAH
jgi:hypothetical protein